MRYDLYDIIIYDPCKITGKGNPVKSHFMLKWSFSYI